MPRAPSASFEPLLHIVVVLLCWPHVLVAHDRVLAYGESFHTSTRRREQADSCPPDLFQGKELDYSAREIAKPEHEIQPVRCAVSTFMHLRIAAQDSRVDEIILLEDLKVPEVFSNSFRAHRFRSTCLVSIYNRKQYKSCSDGATHLWYCVPLSKKTYVANDMYVVRQVGSTRVWRRVGNRKRRKNNWSMCVA